MNNTPNKLNKTVIIIYLILLVLLSLFNIIDQNKISMDAQFTIYTEKTMIIMFARPWDVGISIVNNTGGYRAFSLANGFSSRDKLIGTIQ